MNELKIDAGQIWRRKSDGELFEVNVITGSIEGIAIRLAWCNIDAVFWIMEDALREKYDLVPADAPQGNVGPGNGIVEGK